MVRLDISCFWTCFFALWCCSPNLLATQSLQWPPFDVPDASALPSKPGDCCHDTIVRGWRIIQSTPPNCLLQSSFSLPCLTTLGQIRRAPEAPISIWKTSRLPVAADAPAAYFRFITSHRRPLNKSLIRPLCLISMQTGTTQRVRQCWIVFLYNPPVG